MDDLMDGLKACLFVLLSRSKLKDLECDTNFTSFQISCRVLIQVASYKWFRSIKHYLKFVYIMY